MSIGKKNINHNIVSKMLFRIFKYSKATDKTDKTDKTVLLNSNTEYFGLQLKILI